MMSGRSRRQRPKTGDATSSPVASHARTSAQPASEQESMDHVQGFGESSRGLLAWFDHVSSSWRTWQRSWGEEWESFSETFPRSGSMRNGKLYRRPPLVPRSYVRECLFWPTVRRNDFQPINWHRARLFAAGKYCRSGGGMCNLNDWVGVWAITYSHPHLSTKIGHEDHKTNGRLPVLSVEFAEQFMGFPMGWTELPR